jgi:hypothetical protein
VISLALKTKEYNTFKKKQETFIFEKSRRRVVQEVKLK